MAASITLGGIGFPVADFEGAANVIIDGIRTGQPKEQILESLEPSALSIIETIAGAFIPYGGTAIEVLAFIYSKSIPFKSLSQAEQNAYFNRFGAGEES